MSFVSGLFSGDKGANFTAQGADLTGGTNQMQIDADRARTEGGIDQYGQFLAALQAQNGLQNQSNVYNQLQGIAAGTGPNPAQAMLNQATGQNVAQQAALMASQRGVAANPALIARQAANVGSNIQQQAAGQGATMQANQALNALGQAGALANTQAGQLQQGQNSYNNIVQNQRALTLGAADAQSKNAIANANTQNSANSAVAQGNQKFQGDTVGGIFKGGGAALGMAEGGAVPDVAQGSSGPQSATAKFLKGVGETVAQNSPGSAQPSGGSQTGEAIGSGLMKAGMSAFGSSAAAADGAGGMAQLAQKAGPMAMMLSAGGDVGSKLKQGGKVPGQAKVKGDDYANDVVNAKLSPKEIVLPRSVTMSKDPVKASAAFVAAILAKNRGKI